MTSDIVPAKPKSRERIPKMPNPVVVKIAAAKIEKTIVSYELLVIKNFPENSL